MEELKMRLLFPRSVSLSAFIPVSVHCFCFYLYAMISVREIQQSDIEPLLDYWFTASDEFLIGMGVDLSKMPKRDEFKKMLETQLTQPYNEKQSYCTIWLMADKPIGHCNVGKITYGEEAYMHLHMWRSDIRQKGLGVELVKLSIPYFFENLKLKNLYCEPYALNPAPNNTLAKVGFKFVKEYITVPGIINSEQPVKRWVMSYESFKAVN